MSITAFRGRAGTGKTHACFTRIKEITEQCPGETIFLLVPDSTTYLVERRLAEFMPQQGFTSVQVVGFNRLAHQIFQSLGNKEDQTLSDLGETLLWRALMKEHKEELTLLKGSAEKPGFVSLLKAIYKECEAFRIKATDLKMVAQGEANLSQGLKDKLTDLSLLFEHYEKHLRAGNYENRLEKLISLIPHSPLMEKAHVFIDGFHWFTPLQVELVYTLFNTATEGVITLTLPVENCTMAKAKWNIFHRPYELFSELEARYGSLLKVRDFTEAYRFKGQEKLLHLERDYFTAPSKDLSKTKPLSLPLACAYNSYREVDGVCRKIRKLMMEPNRRWRDITIMLRDSECYGDILEEGLKHYDIPFFSDRRHPMITHPLAELWINVFDVLRGNMSHDTMFRLLKTDFFPLSRSEVDDLENYCLEFGVRERDWHSTKPWTYGHRFWEEDPSENEDQLEEELVNTENSEEEDPEKVRLKRINTSKEVVQSLLAPLLDFGKEAHKAEEWSTKFFSFMEDLKIPVLLTQWSEEALARGALEEASRHEQMYKQWLVLLNEIAQVGLDKDFSIDTIAEVLLEGLESLTYSLVPPTLDHVTITTIERGYTLENKVLFVLGLNDGVFPRHIGDEGLLKDGERKALEAAKVVLAEGALTQAFNENFLIYLAFTRASEELYLSYVSADTEGNALESSLIVRRLLELGYCTEKEEWPLAIPEGKDEDYLWRPYQSFALLSQELGKLSKGEAIGETWWKFYNWGLEKEEYKERLDSTLAGLHDTNDMPLIDKELVRSLFLRYDTFKGSVTRLEKYQQCPFSFFAHYGLKLEERPIKTFASNNRGTFLHESLRLLGERLLREQKQWRDIPSEELEAMCKTAADEVIAADPDFATFEENAYYQNMRSRLDETLERTVQRLITWSQESDFNTFALEQSFGRSQDSWKGIDIPIKDNVSLHLQGQIDRIDRLTCSNEEGEPKNYALVIDYKSGKASINAMDVYYGLKLQLLTYLMALKKNLVKEHIEPAALLYTYVKNPREKSDVPITPEEAQALSEGSKELTNRGYLLNNIEVLEKMYHKLRGSSSSIYVPVRITSKDAIHSGDKNKVKTEAEFSTLLHYTEKVLAQAGEQILDGHFPISPYRKTGSSACDYCSYAALCRFDGGHGQLRYRDLPSLSEEVALEKMKESEEGGQPYEMDR